MSAFTVEHVRALPGSGALLAHRLAALEALEQEPLPTSALEDWRYSRIDDLDLERYRPVSGPGTHPPALPDELVGLLASFGQPAVQVVVRDGLGVKVAGDHPGVTVVELAQDPGGRRAGASVGPGAASAGEAPAGPGVVPGGPVVPAVASVGDGPAGFEVVGSVVGRPDFFALLNEALTPAPLLVEVAPGQVVRRPIVLVQWTGADGAATFARTVVRLGQGAEATVVEVQASADVASLGVPVTELTVAGGARLGYTQVQLLGPRMWQVGHLAGRAGRDASVTTAAVALGGDYARLRTAVTLADPGGSARQLAAYFGAGEQMHDFRTVQDHQAPRTTSDLVYKGVVANRAHAVYTGLIRVEKGAKGTNAYQTNRNLVLHQGAHADSVPNLEIEDNDVRCSHASAVGPVSEDQRFYLESRGVPAPVAERLIALGFLEEVLAELPGVPGSALLAGAVAAKLARAEQIEASAPAGSARR